MSSIDRSVTPYKFLSFWDPFDLDSIIPPCTVVTCFLQKGNRFLVLQRGRRDQQFGLWGIPGGKLDSGELPISGLCRELQEETELCIEEKNISLLGQVISTTTTDGKYGLYLYHACVSSEFQPKITFPEHLSYKWVSVDEFIALPLLHAQGEAFRWVEEAVRERLNNHSTEEVLHV